MQKGIKVNLEKHKDLITAVLYCAVYGEQMGSITTQEANTLLRELETEDYRIRHGIKFKDLSAEDYANMAEEEAEQRYQDSMYED